MSESDDGRGSGTDDLYDGVGATTSDEATTFEAEEDPDAAEA